MKEFIQSAFSHNHVQLVGDNPFPPSQWSQKPEVIQHTSV